jgi:glycosyltransferase involved in cell wall biosynthesis
MIEAMPAILDREPNAKLIFIGGFETPDYLKDIERRIEELHLGGRVQFLGLRNDVWDLYQGMDVLAQPSLWESFPISMLEGMAAGVPIVASDVGGVRECIEHDRSGYLVPANKPDALARAICELINSADKRQSLAAEAKQVIRSRFAPESQIPRILRVFESVSEGKRHRRAA